MSNPIDWPALVRSVRDRLRFTQSDLGDLLMVTAQTVSNWEAGRARPDTLIGSALVSLYRSCKNLSTPVGKSTSALVEFSECLRMNLMRRPQEYSPDQKAECGAVLLRILARDADITLEIPRKSPKGKTPSVR